MSTVPAVQEFVGVSPEELAALNSVASLARDCREAQSRYYAQRTQPALYRARDAERALDRAVSHLLAVRLDQRQMQFSF